MTLANRITIARFLLIPVFVLLTLYYMRDAERGQPNEMLRWAAATLFLLVSLTDALDGFFARSRNERTRLGAMLDPLADKALLLCGLMLLTGPWGRVFQPHLPVWYVLLVVSRDGFLIVGATVIHACCGHVDVRPRLTGKAATVFQMTLILWVLSSGPIRFFPWLLGAAAGATLLSAAQYLLDGIRQMEHAHAHETAAR